MLHELFQRTQEVARACGSKILDTNHERENTKEKLKERQFLKMRNELAVRPRRPTLRCPI